tara:strand:- start:49 stop:285 length:237 start_codon:yes stop_codon:yes gene_type:complete
MLLIITKKTDVPNLKESQAYIGGYVEALHLPNGDMLLFDEDGKYKELDINIEASKLATIQIVGNAILIPKKLLKGTWI